MKHPYHDFEGTELWKVLDREITLLENNRDLSLTTARPYVIGSLCQAVARANLLKTDAPKAS